MLYRLINLVVIDIFLFSYTLRKVLQSQKFNDINKNEKEDNSLINKLLFNIR